MTLAICFLKGLTISLIFGIPAGAIGVLTIRRTLSNGFFNGLCTGFGSTAADLIYSSVGIFGVSIVSEFILRYENIITICGGLFLLLMAIFVLKNPCPMNNNNQKESVEQTATNGKLLVCFSTAFFIALTNPATLLSFLSAFAIFKIATITDVASGVFLIAGILCGSVIWWISLSAVVTVFKKKITDRIYVVLNYILGSVLAVLGVVAVVRGWYLQI